MATGPAIGTSSSTTAANAGTPWTQQPSSGALNFATTVLWAATGKQFGDCPQTVRPCGRYCNGSALGYFWNDGLFSPWLPYVFNGTVAQLLVRMRVRLRSRLLLV